MEFVQINDQKLKTSEFVDQLYEGVLDDEPMNSTVRGTFINGLFYGTIQSARRGIYFVESSKPYLNNSFNVSNEAIVYNESNIKYNSTTNYDLDGQKEKLSFFEKYKNAMELSELRVKKT